MEWTEAKKARLEVLWLADELSTAEIARRLGCPSKSSVVGKAHRMGLPAKPSPIRPVPAPRQPERPHRKTVTLPPLPSLAKPREPRAKPAPPPKPVLSLRPGTSCSWPIGEPRTKGFRTCDALTERGKPYCPDHCKLAYVKIRDRRDDERFAA